MAARLAAVLADPPASQLTMTLLCAWIRLHQPETAGAPNGGSARERTERRQQRRVTALRGSLASRDGTPRGRLT
jgi:hypothetical protein